MPVKIRLARHGRKNSPYYHVVVADSRAPRDGRFIERIGSYNPTTNPATIELNIDRAIDWLRMGAQPTMTARRILSYKGVLLKQHLLEGVRKGAFDQEECERRFAAWMQEKEAKIEAKRKSIAESKVAIKKNRLEAETKVNQARMETLRQKRAEEAAALEAKAKEAAAEAEENIEEAAEQ